MLQCVAMSYSALQCVAVRGSAWQCVVVCHSATGDVRRSSGSPAGLQQVLERGREMFARYLAHYHIHIVTIAYT